MKLVWKYFFQQKFKEIGLFLLIVPAFIFIPYYIGKVLCSFGAECATDTFDVWGLGMLSLSLTLLFIILFMAWIKSNWTKAKNRVNKELTQVTADDDIITSEKFIKEKNKRLPFGLQAGDKIYYKDRWLEVQEVESGYVFDLRISCKCGIVVYYDFEDLTIENVRYKTSNVLGSQEKSK